MAYSPEEKRKILLDNFSNPSQQVELAELKKISADWKVPFSTFRSLETGCGDVIYLLVKKKDNYLEKCLFSGQQSCLITISVANILCSCLERKSLDFACELLSNCQSMTEKREYNIESCPNLKVFSDISQFPHRIECIKLVVRGLIELIDAKL